MSLVAYVSGHGLGHSARELEVLRHLPDDIPLIVKTSAPDWFWHSELRRPFTMIADSFDVGCVQKNGLEMDLPATLRAWEQTDAENQGRYDQEVHFLHDQQARLVLSDVPAFPLEVAARAGVPSVCIANFTWADIYRAFIDDEPAFAGIAARLEAEYARATLHLDAGFSLEMPYFATTEPIGLVARAGRDRRAYLLTHLPPMTGSKRLALVYVSGWGMPIAYEKVGTFADWHFISLDPPPCTLPNWTTIPRTLMAHPDLVASVDLVISKPGYGLAAECVSLGTPLLYPPRERFMEYYALDAVVSAWEGGFKIPMNEFLTVAWENWLEAIPERGTIPEIEAAGGLRAAAILTRLYTEAGGT